MQEEIPPGKQTNSILMIISLLQSCTVVMSNTAGPHNKDRLPRLKSFNKRNVCKTHLPSGKYQKRKAGHIALPNHHHLLLGGNLGTPAQTSRHQCSHVVQLPAD
jgi:hypothetical protein